MQHVAQIPAIAMIDATMPNKNISIINTIADPMCPLQSAFHATFTPSTTRTRFKYIVGTTKQSKKNLNVMHAMA